MKNHQTLVETVRLEGPGFIDCYIEQKERRLRKRQERDMAKAKASGRQILRMIGRRPSEIVQEVNLLASSDVVGIQPSDPLASLPRETAVSTPVQVR